MWSEEFVPHQEFYGAFTPDQTDRLTFQANKLEFHWTTHTLAWAGVSRVHKSWEESQVSYSKETGRWLFPDGGEIISLRTTEENPEMICYSTPWLLLLILLFLLVCFFSCVFAVLPPGLDFFFWGSRAVPVDGFDKPLIRHSHHSLPVLIFLNKYQKGNWTLFRTLHYHHYVISCRADTMM